jgi:threonine/homoserine/homoserine lactone efflux protein
MSSEILFTYIITVTLLLVIPGPTIILVISQAVMHGRKSVLPLVAGVVTGDFTSMTLSLLGLGAMMAASATLFTLLKWLGAIYLFYLGIKLWQAKPHDDGFIQHEKRYASPRSLLMRSFTVTALNPKGIAFFVAFFPQFINPHSPAFSQIFILGGIFLILALVNAALYAFFAAQIRKTMNRYRVRSWLNRCGGTALIGAGIFTAGMQRSL